MSQRLSRKLKAEFTCIFPKNSFFCQYEVSSVYEPCYILKMS
uniref:Uncharacterized protein n=1 Tax=Anguilla anguilla TaxID=7936 RepID=A0A0E9VYE5_ANGAN